MSFQYAPYKITKIGNVISSYKQSECRSIGSFISEKQQAASRSYSYSSIGADTHYLYTRVTVGCNS